jgi:single-strand DNA-binding protein
MNKVILIGNVVKDVETATVIKQNGDPARVGKVELAVRGTKKINGQYETHFFKCVAFDKLVEILEKYVKKGHKLGVTGSLYNSSWDKPDGTKMYSTQINISEVELLTTKTEVENSQITSVDPLVVPLINNGYDLPKLDPTTLGIANPF